MNWNNDESFGKVETAVAEAVRRSDGDVRAAVRVVADEVARDLRVSATKGAAMLSTISALADGAARGAADSGADIGAVAEGFMIGAMRGAEEIPERTLTVIRHAADSFVKHALQSGFDAATAARGLAAGASEGAHRCALDEDAAESAAVQGAARSADDVDARLGRKVRAALVAYACGAAPSVSRTR